MQPTLHSLMASLQNGITYFRVSNWKALSSSDLLQPLETTIETHRIPALTGQSPPGKLVWEMVALPATLGGLGLMNPVAIVEEQHDTSQLICAPLIERILQQDNQLTDCQAAQQDIKARIHSNKRSRQKEDARKLQN